MLSAIRASGRGRAVGRHVTWSLRAGGVPQAPASTAFLPIPGLALDLSADLTEPRTFTASPFWSLSLADPLAQRTDAKSQVIVHAPLHLDRRGVAAEEGTGSIAADLTEAAMALVCQPAGGASSSWSALPFRSLGDGVDALVTALSPRPGDEALVVTPCEAPTLRALSSHGLSVHGLPLRRASNEPQTSSLALNLDELEARITEQTRLLWLGASTSAVGKVFSRGELEALAEVLARHPQVVVVSDESLRPCTYDDLEASPALASLCPDLASRTITMVRLDAVPHSEDALVMGGCLFLGPQTLLDGAQSALEAARAALSPPQKRRLLASLQEVYGTELLTSLVRQAQVKRDQLVQVLDQSGLPPLVPQAGHSVVVDCSWIQAEARILSETAAVHAHTDIAERPDQRACDWLLRHIQVRAGPMSPLYTAPDRHLANALIRMTFWTDDDTLALAKASLIQWFARSEAPQSHNQTLHQNFREPLL